MTDPTGQDLDLVRDRQLHQTVLSAPPAQPDGDQGGFGSFGDTAPHAGVLGVAAPTSINFDPVKSYILIFFFFP